VTKFFGGKRQASDMEVEWNLSDRTLLGVQWGTRQQGCKKPAQDEIANPSFHCSLLSFATALFFVLSVAFLAIAIAVPNATERRIKQ
jgi:hypothetical protein